MLLPDLNCLAEQGQGLHWGASNTCQGLSVVDYIRRTLLITLQLWQSALFSAAPALSGAKTQQ